MPSSIHTSHAVQVDLLSVHARPGSVLAVWREDEKIRSLRLRQAEGAMLYEDLDRYGQDVPVEILMAMWLEAEACPMPRQGGGAWGA
jgi:hypothetical protein